MDWTSTFTTEIEAVELFDADGGFYGTANMCRIEADTRGMGPKGRFQYDIQSISIVGKKSDGEETTHTLKGNALHHTIKGLLPHQIKHLEAASEEQWIAYDEEEEVSYPPFRDELPGGISAGRAP